MLQTLRRLAQNREAARKSRLRKKVSQSTKKHHNLKKQIMHAYISVCAYLHKHTLIHVALIKVQTYVYTLAVHMQVTPPLVNYTFPFTK